MVARVKWTVCQGDNTVTRRVIICSRLASRPVRYKTERNISHPDILIHPMDYSTGALNAMYSNFLPHWLREDLGPYLVDKTKLIENIIVDHSLIGRQVDLVLRPRCSGKSIAQVIMFLISALCTNAFRPVLFFLLKPLVLVIPNRVCFSQAYISRLDRISTRSTWESTQLFSVTSKFVYLSSKVFRQLVYA